MLCLNLKKLSVGVNTSHRTCDAWHCTEKVTLWSSKVLRIKSRPALGTWVSFSIMWGGEWNRELGWFWWLTRYLFTKNKLWREGLSSKRFNLVQSTAGSPQVLHYPSSRHSLRVQASRLRPFLTRHYVYPSQRSIQMPIRADQMQLGRPGVHLHSIRYHCARKRKIMASFTPKHIPVAVLMH